MITRLVYTTTILLVLVPGLNAAQIELNDEPSSEQEQTRACCNNAIINQKLRTIETKVDAVQSKVMVVDSKVDALTQDVIDLGTTISVDLGILSNDVANLNDDVNETLSKVCIVDSKVDEIQTDITDLDTTIQVNFAMVDDSLTSNMSKLVVIDSKVDTLSSPPCAATPITTAGTTISSPGHYCVANALSGATPLITIAASDVFLDLNGQELSATGNAIVFDTTAQRIGVTIANGFLVGDGTGIGISLPTTGTPHEQIIIKDLSTRAFSDGINADSISDVKIKNCMCNNNSSYGLVLGAGSGITVEHSMFNDNTLEGVHMNVGGTTPSCVEFVNCQANGNTDGFAIEGADIVFRHCFACGNSNNGFTAVNPLLARLCLVDSVAKSNGNAGISMLVGDGLVKENLAIGNINCGYDTTVATTSGFVANLGKGNGATPANGVADTNYCLSGVGTAIPTAPYNQVAPPGVSYWNNITMP